MSRANANAVVAANVRRLRRNRNLSQEQFAELAKLHRTYVGAIERGERNITLNTLEQIANALGVSCAVLLTPTEHRKAR
ncbi:MAG: helix-turn-helix transcriptional regulator [Acidobacteriales bacterium]|nr:helix-turn-helix transcriptional regulator [Terriglobales bacterium]